MDFFNDASVAALVAVVGAALITWSAQRRSLRRDLALRMAEAGYGAFRRTSQFRRWKRWENPSRESISHELSRREDSYTEDRIALSAIQQSVDLYFGRGSVTSKKWHRVVDQLFAYHMSTDEKYAAQAADVLPKIAGPDHSGLAVADLADAHGLESRFRAELDDAMAAVLRGWLRLRQGA